MKIYAFVLLLVAKRVVQLMIWQRHGKPVVRLTVITIWFSLAHRGKVVHDAKVFDRADVFPRNCTAHRRRAGLFEIRGNERR